MFTSTKAILARAKERRAKRRQTLLNVRRLDSQALTELGFPPDQSRIGTPLWFLYL